MAWNHYPSLVLAQIFGKSYTRESPNIFARPNVGLVMRYSSTLRTLLVFILTYINFLLDIGWFTYFFCVGNLKSLLQLFNTLDDTMVVLLSKARTMPLNVLMMKGLLSFTKSYWVVTAVRMEGCHYFQTPNFSSFCPSHKWLFHVFRVLVGVF